MAFNYTFGSISSVPQIFASDSKGLLLGYIVIDHQIYHFLCEMAKIAGDELIPSLLTQLLECGVDLKSLKDIMLWSALFNELLKYQVKSSCEMTLICPHSNTGLTSLEPSSGMNLFHKSTATDLWDP